MGTSRSARDKRVNLLLLTTGLGIGGAEVVVRDLVRSIDNGRFKVSVCCLSVLGSIGEELAREGVDIETLPRPGRQGSVDYLTFLRLRKVLRAKKIDVVHTHTTYALTDATLCKLTMPGLKLVHTFHFGNYPHRDRRTLWMEGLCARIADGLVAVGDVQRRQIQSVYRLGDSRITTVWNGVQRLHNAGDPTFRSRLGDAGTVLVGTLANLIDQKGLPDLLKVARRVKDVHANVRFVIAGEGKLRADLERLRAELGLDDTVVFAGWIRNAASAVLPAVDIYFQPSLWEAMSIAILEAMAAGRPVVATSVGEAPSMIEDGENGMLTPPGDVVGMADSICRLIEDPLLRRRLGDLAARKAAEQFGVDHMARAYENVYLGVLGRHDAC